MKTVWLMLGAVVFVGWSSRSAKAEGIDDVSRTVAAADTRPSAWMRETGRVAIAFPSGQATDITGGTQGQRQGENPVRVHASQAEKSRAVVGQVNRPLLEMEAQPYLRDLRACPIEVARRRQVPLTAIESGDVALSFTIQPNGTVTGAQAVASGEPDAELLTCVGQRMFGWHFSPPDGGPARVDMLVSLQGGARLTTASR